MTHFDAEALLADSRRKGKRAEEAARRARSKLGVQTATRREVYVDKSDRPFAWLFDGQDPDVVVRDSASIKQIFNIWKRYPRRHSRETSTVRLPSGREFVFDHRTGEASRP